MATAIAHPVRTLRDLVTTLEATITLTLADPKPKPVHRLRTTTRRIEAQLELLSLLPDLPNHAKPAAKARKLLRKLHRAAGRVRDLDVQRDLIHSRSREATHLRSLLKHRRDEAADQLLDTLHHHQPRLTRTLESLLHSLTPAEPLTLTPSHLTQLTLHWFTHNTPAAPKPTHRQLHDTRKAAKIARYIAESANLTTKSKIKRLANTFESLQQSGGKWHDWLTLSDIAHSELGHSSPLTQSFTHRCEESMASYRRHLKSFAKNLPVTTLAPKA